MAALIVLLVAVALAVAGLTTLIVVRVRTRGDDLLAPPDAPAEAISHPIAPPDLGRERGPQRTAPPDTTAAPAAPPQPAVPVEAEPLAEPVVKARLRDR